MRRQDGRLVLSVCGVGGLVICNFLVLDQVNDGPQARHLLHLGLGQTILVLSMLAKAVWRGERLKGAAATCLHGLLPATERLNQVGRCAVE